MINDRYTRASGVRAPARVPEGAPLTRHRDVRRFGCRVVLAVFASLAAGACAVAPAPAPGPAPAPASASGAPPASAAAATAERPAGDSSPSPARLTAADSALVRRILVAEERGDAADAALAEGARHFDARVRLLARRAAGRIRDPKFAGRDSFPVPPPTVAWPEPAWRLRYRALVAPAAAAGRAGGAAPSAGPDAATVSPAAACRALRLALADSAWPVRLRAADLATSACAADDTLAAILRAWVDALPADASARARGGVSWHAAAHGIVALARVHPADARARLGALASHAQPQVRAYAARAAAVLADTGTVRALARDPDDNVKEVALERLSALTGHGDDATYLAALAATGAPAVRAAAVALKGSPRADVARAADGAFPRWAAHGNASERDVRVALLEAAGRPASEDRPPARIAELAPRAVALALGGEEQLVVRMSPASGGGTFVVRLRGDVAPLMAARILQLAEAGYYDRLAWHRVEPDFVIQGGSPGSNEYVGYPRYLRDELGTLSHARGTVGMSTRGHDTGDAQWFVNLRDNARLARDYTVFAEVVEGIDVVDGVLEGDVIECIGTAARCSAAR